jgi:hypothetical protein
VTEKSHTNFLGIEVKGDITRGDRRSPQRPLSELEPLMRAVLDDPTMKAFGWAQYTPYFNDGDSCTFSVGELWFLTVDDPDVEDVEDSYDYRVGYSEHPSLGKAVSSVYSGPDEERFNRVRALSDAINGGAFEDVLLEAFGDHAEVIVKPSGITVDYYSHD